MTVFRTISRPFAKSILALCCVGLSLNTAFAQAKKTQKTAQKNVEKMDLRQAIAEKIVSAELVGLGGFNSKCVALNLVNLSARRLEITLEAGEFLQPANPGEQRLLVGETVRLAMAAKQAASSPIYAFCSQHHNASPSARMQFRASGRAPQDLYDLAKLIEKNKFFSAAAQESVWCLSDNGDVQWLMSNDPTEEKMLREYVAAIKHIDLTKLPKIRRTTHIYSQVGLQQKTIKLDRDYIDKSNGEADKKITAHTQQRNQEAAADMRKDAEMATWTIAEISGKMAVTMREPALLTIDIIDPEGNVLTQCYKSEDVVQGKANIPYKYQAYHLPKGSYKIRASGNGKVIKEEVYELK